MAEFLRTGAGRLRLGWRIFLFLALFVVFSVPFAVFPLRGLPWEALPLLGSALLAGWALLALEGRAPGALGFYLAPEALKGALLGLGLGVGVALLVLGGIFAVGGVRWSWEEGTAWAWAQGALASLWLFALPAAGEEALLRGYVLQALAEEWGGAAALGLTALLFALLHLWNPSLTAVGLGNLLVAGLFLGAVYLKTASLWWATGAHLGWNWALGFLGDLPVSGLELVDAPLVDPWVQSHGWASGGAFGPEASLVTTLVLGGATLLIWHGRFLQPGAAARRTHPLILARSGADRAPGPGEGSSNTGDSWRTT